MPVVLLEEPDDTVYHLTLRMIAVSDKKARVFVPGCGPKKGVAVLFKKNLKRTVSIEEYLNTQNPLNKAENKKHPL